MRVQITFSLADLRWGRVIGCMPLQVGREGCSRIRGYRLSSSKFLVVLLLGQPLRLNLRRGDFDVVVELLVLLAEVGPLGVLPAMEEDGRGYDL